MLSKLETLIESESEILLCQDSKAELCKSILEYVLMRVAEKKNPKTGVPLPEIIRHFQEKGYERADIVTTIYRFEDSRIEFLSSHFVPVDSKSGPVNTHLVYAGNRLRF